MTLLLIRVTNLINSHCALYSPKPRTLLHMYTCSHISTRHHQVVSTPSLIFSLSALCHSFSSLLHFSPSHSSVCNATCLWAKEIKIESYHDAPCRCHHANLSPSVPSCRTPWPTWTPGRERSTRAARATWASRPTIASRCPHPRTRPQ